MTTRIVFEFEKPPAAKDVALLTALAEKFNASVVEIPNEAQGSKRPVKSNKNDFPGIEKTPGVCGGLARVAGTRIPVWSLVTWKNLGMSDENLLYEFETLTTEGLRAAWAYYNSFKEEIDAQVAENQQL